MRAQEKVKQIFNERGFGEDGPWDMEQVRQVLIHVWAEAYQMGVYDERTSRENPIDFGFGAQIIEPQRYNEFLNNEEQYSNL